MIYRRLLSIQKRFLLLQLPRRVVVAPATAVRAALVVATLGDVLLTRCCGSRLRVNLQPTHLVGELAAEFRRYRATESALAVGCVQHLGGRHDRLMRLRVFRVLHAQLNVGIDRQEILASLR